MSSLRQGQQRPNDAWRACPPPATRQKQNTRDDWTCSLWQVAIKLALALCHILFSDPQPAWATGSAGSYAIVFDAAGEPIAGTYWIAPNVRVVMRGHGRPGSGRPALPTLTPFLMDREFLPNRLSAPVWLHTLRLDYSPSPTIDALKLGVPIAIVRRDFTPILTAIDAMAARPEPAAVPETHEGSMTLKLTLLASQELMLGDAKLTAHMVETRAEDPARHALIPPVRTLLLAETGMMIDQDIFALPVRIEQGALTSSVDFVTYFEMLAYRTRLPATAACLEAKRMTDAFKAASVAYRDMTDAYTANSFPLSRLSYETAKSLKDIEAQVRDALTHLLCRP